MKRIHMMRPIGGPVCLRPYSPGGSAADTRRRMGMDFSSIGWAGVTCRRCLATQQAVRAAQPIQGSRPDRDPHPPPPRREEPAPPSHRAPSARIGRPVRVAR